jgi:hypothetical protein
MTAGVNSGKSGNANHIGSGNDKSSAAERHWLARGLAQVGGKLPLFDEWGQRINERTIRACIDHGWAEPWFTNPIKPDWLVCRLTNAGRKMLEESAD